MKTILSAGALILAMSSASHAGELNRYAASANGSIQELIAVYPSLSANEQKAVDSQLQQLTALQTNLSRNLAQVRADRGIDKRRKKRPAPPQEVREYPASEHPGDRAREWTDEHPGGGG